MDIKDRIKSIVDFVMDLDALTRIDSEEREHIETAVIEGYKAGIKEVTEFVEDPNRSKLVKIPAETWRLLFLPEVEWQAFKEEHND